MTGSNEADSATWLAGEPPAEARVLALLPPAPSGTAGARWAGAVCQIARSLARRHGRALLLDLAGPDAGLFPSLGVPPSPGLRQVLRGEAALTEVAVPSAGRGFIYVPTGGPGGADLWDDGACGPALWRLVERARTAAAVLLLAPPGEPCPPQWFRLLDGAVELREEPAAPGAARVESRVVALFRPAGDRGSPHLHPPAGGRPEVTTRRLIAAGKWEGALPGTPRGEPAAAGAPADPGVEPSVPAPGPPAASPRRRSLRPRRALAPSAASRRRPMGPAGVLLPLAFLAYCVLLVVWFQVERPAVSGGSREVGPPGAPALHPVGPTALRPSPAWASAADSSRLSLPPPLPYSTFTAGYVPRGAVPSGRLARPPSQPQLQGQVQAHPQGDRQHHRVDKDEAQEHR